MLSISFINHCFCLLHTTITLFHLLRDHRSARDEETATAAEGAVSGGGQAIMMGVYVKTKK